MPRRRRPVVGLPLAAALVVLVAACGATPSASPAPTADPAATGAPVSPRPVGGRELYGYVPYWEMDRGIAAHLTGTPLTTLAMFSVTDRSDGTIDTRQRGYRAITGAIGRRMIEVAREQGMRVELVFTSFGRERNEAFFRNLERQDAAIAGLVEIVGDLGLDGVNVDVESMPIGLVEPYGAFVARLKTAVEAADPADRVTVATQANLTGAAAAAAAARAGVERIFLMGYDYRVNASWPGAVAPLDRRDDGERDLEWSLDVYALAGVPADRILLGLPLYGRSWPVTDAELGAPPIGRGEEWFPERNVAFLSDPAVVPVRDEIEVVELYVVDGEGRFVPAATAPPVVRPPAGSGTPGTPPTAPPPTRPPDGLRAIYVDSPATLERKLGLVDERGLAGGGFWAIGYERGLPAYTELMARFVAGDPME